MPAPGGRPYELAISVRDVPCGRVWDCCETVPNDRKDCISAVGAAPLAELVFRKRFRDWKSIGGDDGGKDWFSDWGDWGRVSD